MSVKDLPDLISPYFTEETIFNVLKTKFNLNNPCIKSIQFGEKSKKGDSYLSNVVRFTITASGNVSDVEGEKEVVLPVICKIIPKNKGRSKTFRSRDFFENEKIFYYDVWPAMEKFVNSKGAGNYFNIIPSFYSAYTDSESGYVALEDVSPKGYRNVLRGDCFDFDHILICLRLFAKFHAISLAYKDQRPEEFEAFANKLQETYFSEKLREWYCSFQKKLFKIVLDAVEKQLPTQYLRRLEELLADDFFGKVIELCKSNDSLSVVTHGDVWIPNFLMKYAANKKPLDIMLIDFQLARYTTPGNDLMFFLYACVDQRLRELHWDTFLEEYHKTVQDTLQLLGSEKTLLTMDALKADIKQKSIFGIAMGMEAITMSMLEDDEVSDIDSIQGDEAVPLESVWIVHPFKAEEKRQRLADMIKHAVDNNFI